MERASARESAAQVAIGALAKLFFVNWGLKYSHVIAVGETSIADREIEWEKVEDSAEEIPAAAPTLTLSSA